MAEPRQQRWTELLSDEDLAFIKRFVLASGSLKDLAQVYDISYPTVRLRLDRIIQKMQLLEDHNVTDEFERLLRVSHADGKLDAATFKALLDAYQAGKEQSDA